jgi:hypothetical protein
MALFDESLVNHQLAELSPKVAGITADTDRAITREFIWLFSAVDSMV